ncbi:hypothetical protein E8E13_003969 [Curvularia kusanoi]|uniref:Transmembrane protein n=1 Tax=Curvularia kusanoi TaxID=90978 RepID=A0A9P4W6K8_CURKU|nr:hypothetical protein E8E13_003969 [Curvularia kusanoi]
MAVNRTTTELELERLQEQRSRASVSSWVSTQVDILPASRVISRRDTEHLNRLNNSVDEISVDEIGENETIVDEEIIENEESSADHPGTQLGNVSNTAPPLTASGNGKKSKIRINFTPKTIISATGVLLGIIIAAVALSPAYRSVALTHTGNALTTLGNRLAQKEHDLTVYDWCEAHPEFVNGTYCQSTMAAVRDRMMASYQDERNLRTRSLVRPPPLNITLSIPWKSAIPTATVEVFMTLWAVRERAPARILIMFILACALRYAGRHNPAMLIRSGALWWLIAYLVVFAPFLTQSIYHPGAMETLIVLSPFTFQVINKAYRKSWDPDERARNWRLFADIQSSILSLLIRRFRGPYGSTSGGDIIKCVSQVYSARQDASTTHFSAYGRLKDVLLMCDREGIEGLEDLVSDALKNLRASLMSMENEAHESERGGG